MKRVNLKYESVYECPKWERSSKKYRKVDGIPRFQKNAVFNTN